MELEKFSTYIGIALASILATGTISSATVEMIKLLVNLITKGTRKLSLQVINILSALISMGVAYPILINEGTPKYLAIIALLVAAFTPKIAYDLATIPNSIRKCTPTK